MTTRLPLRFTTGWTVLCLLSTACMVVPAFSQEKVQTTPVNPDMVQTGTDIPSKWKRPDAAFDYTRREVMIPMRDGVKLFTVLNIPKDAHGLPLLLERTPYNAGMFSKTTSPTCAMQCGLPIANGSMSATSWWPRMFAASMALRAIT